jgi:chromosome segregation ATPase
MIEFNCVHCGNQFRVAEEHAGRNGWCKVCKGSVVVPVAPPAGAAVVNDAGPVVVSQLREEIEALKATQAGLQSRLELAEPLAARVAEVEAEHTALTQQAGDGERARSEFEQAIRESIAQTRALENTLEERRAEVEQLSQALDHERRDRETAESALQEAREAGDEAAAAKRDLEATVEELRLELEGAASRTESLEHELAETRDEAAVAKRDLEATVEELRLELEGAASRTESLEHELAETRDEAAVAKRDLEATIEGLQLELEGATSRTESLQQELTEARERLEAIERLEASLAEAEERMDEMGSRVERIDSEVEREFEAAEDLAVETADGLKRLSEVLVAQQSMLEQLKSEEVPAEERDVTAIPLALAPDEGESEEESELEPEARDDRDNAVADAFLRFIEGQ